MKCCHADFFRGHLTSSAKFPTSIFNRAGGSTKGVCVAETLGTRMDERLKLGVMGVKCLQSVCGTTPMNIWRNEEMRRRVYVTKKLGFGWIRRLEVVWTCEAYEKSSEECKTQ